MVNTDPVLTVLGPAVLEGEPGSAGKAGRFCWAGHRNSKWVCTTVWTSSLDGMVANSVSYQQMPIMCVKLYPRGAPSIVVIHT